MNEILMMENNESISKDKFKRYIRKLQETVIAEKVGD